MNKHEVIKNFEFMLLKNKVNALSKISLEQPLTDVQHEDFVSSAKKYLKELTGNEVK